MGSKEIRKEEESMGEGYRIETDSIGSREVPAQAYYGVQSVRAAENFPNLFRRGMYAVQAAELSFRTLRGWNTLPPSRATCMRAPYRRRESGCG